MSSEPGDLIKSKGSIRLPTNVVKNDMVERYAKQKTKPRSPTMELSEAVKVAKARQWYISERDREALRTLIEAVESLTPKERVIARLTQIASEQSDKSKAMFLANIACVIDAEVF